MKTHNNVSITVLIAILALVPNVSATGYMDGANWTGIDSILDSSGYSFLKSNTGMSNPTTADFVMGNYNITGLGQNESYSYLIWTDGTNYYAKNGSTAMVDFISTNFSYVLQSTLDKNVRQIILNLHQITMTHTITISKSVRIVGLGRGLTIITYTGTGTAIYSNGGTGWGGTAFNIQLEDFSILNGATAERAILFKGVGRGSKIKNIDTGDAAQWLDIGTEINESNYVDIYDSKFSGYNVGLKLTYANWIIRVVRSEMYSEHTGILISPGLYGCADDSNNIDLIDIKTYGGYASGGYGIDIGSGSTFISNPYFENTDTGIKLRCSSNVIQGGKFNNLNNNSIYLASGSTDNIITGFVGMTKPIIKDADVSWANNIIVGDLDSQYGMYGRYAVGESSRYVIGTFKGTDPNDGSSVLDFIKSNNNTLGSYTQTSTGNPLGTVNFRGVNNNNIIASGASIYVIQNGSSGTYVPTDMILSTYNQTSVNDNQLVLHTDGSVSVSGNLSIGKIIKFPDGSFQYNVSQLYTGSSWDWFLMPSKVFGTGVTNNNNGSVTISSILPQCPSSLVNGSMCLNYTTGAQNNYFDGYWRYTNGTVI